jgi:hypothetical protein
MRSFSHAGIVVCLATASCASALTEGREPSVAILASGLRSPELVVDSGGLVSFVNADGRVHQIYSPDCPELASQLLHPGESHRAVLGEGPKLCHFEDLVAPSDEAYAGTVQVQKSQRQPGRP